MKKISTIFPALIVLVSVFFIAYLSVFEESQPFSLGLDLAGGSQLTYTADVSKVPSSEVDGRLSALKDVIERRVNILGVSEPSVYTSKTSLLTGLPQRNRLIVELPGVSDIEEAIKAIGETPYLEFKVYNSSKQDFDFIGLNGGHINSSEVQFLQGVGGALTSEPVVLLNFNREGAKLFADVTRANLGNRLGIFIDDVPISTPVIQSAILGGVTQITGNFTIDSAKELSNSLNFGALPLPISLEETRTVNPTLGADTLSKSAIAGLIAFGLIALMFLFVYRLLGLIAILSLIVYGVLVLSLLKLIPVVLTAAGLAGFVMSFGFAVDANVLIFERMREEFRDGRHFSDAIDIGFKRAWASIRDANATSLIIAILLFWFGTSLVKGFAFTFAIGILVSMATAYVISRFFLKSFEHFFPKYVFKVKK